MNAGSVGIDLRAHVRTLKRRRWTIVGVTVGVIVVALLYTLHQSRAYQAKSQVLILPRGTQSVFDTSNNQQAQTAPFSSVETEIAVLQGDPVRRIVRSKIGSAPKVSGARVGETEVMQITAHAPKATQAARIANAYANAYVQVRQQESASALQAASRDVRTKIADLQSQLDAMDAQVAAASESRQSAVQNANRPRYDAIVAQQDQLAQRANELDVDASLNSAGAQLVKGARTPSSPISPTPVRNFAAALALGLLLGISAAYAREHFDDSIKTKDELARVGGPVLGAIPVIREAPGDERAPILRNITEPAVGEAFRAVRTAVQLLGVDRPLRTLQITSPVAGEGKTTTAAGLGSVLAAAGQRVVMVDADLRNPRLHEVAGVPNERGFTSLLVDHSTVLDNVVAVPEVPGLHLLPAGPVPPNPSELLASKSASELLFELRQHFDVVLLDSAPVLPVTDSTLLAAWAEAVLIVVRAGVSTRKQLADARELLGQVDVRVGGTILNGAGAEATYAYGYGYGYGSTPPEQITPVVRPETPTAATHEVRENGERRPTWTERANP